MKKTPQSLIQQFKNLQKIGTGLTSSVYKAFHSELGQICLKIIDPKFYLKPIGKLLIDNQIKLLKLFNHQNLLKLKSHSQNQNENIIVTQFCEGGNLYDRLKKIKKFTEQQTIQITYKIAQALKQLHSKSVIHRDLKPQNIFFKKNEPILADFGFAVHVENTSLNKVNAGSPLYMAPEALQKLQFSYQSDIFALGVIIYQMLKGYTPWCAGSQKQLFKNMLSIKPTIELKNKKLEKLIMQCLQPKKQKRTKLSQIINFLKEQFNLIKNKSLSKQNKEKKSFFLDITNTKKQKKKSIYSDMSSNEKQNKSISFCLQNLKLKNTNQNKQNCFDMNLSIFNIKTQRLPSVQIQNKNKTKSFLLCQNDNKNQQKTKRNYTNKLQNQQKDFIKVLIRLNPDKMKFLPSSMIQKFKFILKCYLKIIQGNKQINQFTDRSSKNIPKQLKNDKISMQIAQIKEQKQLCSHISSYIGRMYRLAKNYKTSSQFMKDIESLYHRVESFSA